MIRKLYNTDEEIIKGIRDNDDHALKVLYNNHFPMVLNFILNNNGTEQEAKDIYQESIIIFYKKIRDNTFELNCKIKTFIYSICRRLWLNSLKEKKIRINRLLDIENFIILERDEENEIMDSTRRYRIMNSSLIKLGEPCRTILVDFYINRISIKEIMVKMGYNNTNTAKNQKYKCLQRLKSIFFSDYNSNIKKIRHVV